MAMRTSRTNGRRPTRTHARNGSSKNGATAKNGKAAAGSQAVWEGQRAVWESKYAQAKERPGLYPFTISGIPIKPLYGPEDVAGMDLPRDLAHPGEYPFTRGVHPTMYRGRMFTMRQFAGFGTAQQTNQRFHYRLDHGQTGLSIAFDNPTIMG